MTDLAGALFALLLIVALAWDNRHYGHVWTDRKEVRYPHDGRRHFR